MEAESFEDEEIAEFLNRRFVAVKVDREERPDLDAVYMSAVLQPTGTGGWPMSVWLTAAREPFFAGTYFPPRDGVRSAQRGFLSLLCALSATFPIASARRRRHYWPFSRTCRVHRRCTAPATNDYCLDAR